VNVVVLTFKDLQVVMAEMIVLLGNITRYEMQKSSVVGNAATVIL
jgi:hypothetical protein